MAEAGLVIPRQGKERVRFFGRDNGDSIAVIDRTVRKSLSDRFQHQVESMKDRGIYAWLKLSETG